MSFVVEIPTIFTKSTQIASRLGNTTLTGNETIQGNLVVNGSFSLNPNDGADTNIVYQSLDISSTLTVQGDSHLNYVHAESIEVSGNSLLSDVSAQNMDLSGNINCTGALTVSENSTISSAFVGNYSSNSNWCQFSHLNRSSSTEYSFLSESAGGTYINSRTGYKVYIKVNNQDVVNVDNTGMNVTGAIETTENSIFHGTAEIGQRDSGGSVYAQFSHKDRNGDSDYSFLSANNGDTLVNAKSGSGIYLRTNNQARMTIGDSHVTANVTFYSGITHITSAGIAYTGSNATGSSNRIGFRWGNSNIYGSVDNAVSVVVGSASDRRIKANITTLTDGFELINKLRPVMFDIRDVDISKTNTEGDDAILYDSSGIEIDCNCPDPVVVETGHIGFIADEVFAVLPQFATNKANILNSVNYAGLTPLLTLCIQQLNQKNIALEAQLASVLLRLDALEST